MRGDRERTLAAGCDGYIHKPLDVDCLPRQMARFLHREDWERDEKALAPERDSYVWWLGPAPTTVLAVLFSWQGALSSLC
jgi:CheY-like chemotaxis protein